MQRIPNSVLNVVGDVLGAHYYNHARLESLFREAGAPGDPPEGNCADKCRAWLRRCNIAEGAGATVVLGRVLEEFMDYEVTGENFGDEEWEKRRSLVRAALNRAGLEYRYGGTVIGPGRAGPTKALREIVRNRNLAALDDELARALETVDSDPPAALTAACAIIEAACKVYIEDEGLTPPKEQTVMPLWKVVRDHLGLDPQRIEDADMARILGGLASVVDGLGAFRTHAGSAHGRGRKQYRVASRHARLAVDAAHTLVAFMLETWEVRRQEKAHS